MMVNFNERSPSRRLAHLQLKRSEGGKIAALNFRASLQW
jgi:hypothetical protein